MSTMTKKKFNDYYLGLDIGTESVGWAVTDMDYKIEKLNGKSLWGVRLFEEAKTAEERRVFRSGRRRLERRKQRTKLLQELFAEEISLIDQGFYLRLEESKFYPDDKSVLQENTLFNDENFKDKDYHSKYPTIYHLRKAFINGEDIKDIRLLYLAINHILKHRGHFLFEGQKLEMASSFGNVFKELARGLYDEFGIDLDTENTTEIEDVIKDNSINITNKKKKLTELLTTGQDENKNVVKEIITALAGGKFTLSKIFNDSELDNSEVAKVAFKDANYEDKVDTINSVLQEKAYIIEKIKAIYDWGILADLMDGEMYISFAKTKIYDEHKNDLKITKRILKEISSDIYKEFFVELDKPNNYCAYIGQGQKTCNQEDMCKYLEKLIGKIKIQDADFETIKQKLELRTLFPKQVSKDNGTIPYQMHKLELEKILENAEKNFVFLKNIDETGYSVTQKIIKILEFRIPYYVGPLNDAHKDDGFAWIVKHKNEKIRPWNFEDVVDLEESAEKFILRMTNKCTYMFGADVLPQNSILYSKFMVLNELNNLRIDGEKVNVNIKQQIFDNLFMKEKRVTGKKLRAYLTGEKIIDKQNNLSGFDIDFKASMGTYIDLRQILGEKINESEMVEDIIKSIVLFGNDKKILKSKLKKHYEDRLTEDEIKKICNKKLSGWGRLSKELLTDVYSADKETGELVNIITALWEDASNPNLMNLLSNNYEYLNEIKKYNSVNGEEVNKITYDILNDLYVSPSVKRQLWQTLTIVKEVRKVMGHEPKKIFIEMARGPEEKKRSESRKNKLINLYNTCKDDQRNWIGELNDRDEAAYRSDRLYLYYTQMGKCMYSGTPIDIEKLFDKNIYDVDHIYPQSKTKDDSLDNRVLVLKNCNSEKGDKYPINSDWQQKQLGFWSLLCSKEFISKRKFDRLTRKTEFTADELADFVARQLVETRQTTKAAAELMGKVFKDAEIVYVKAKHVSDFRQQFNFIKSRDINDLHHAKDAFLNIVVGNVYNTKFTKNPVNFIKKAEPRSYSLNRMFDFNVSRGDTTAWVVDDSRTIIQVKKNMKRNDILFTRLSTERKGGFYNQQLLKAGKGQAPIKSKDPRLHNIDRYGGYNSVSGAYFFLVEHEEKGKLVRTIEYISIVMAKQITDISKLEDYCLTDLKLINPRILISKIKYNALFEIDGLRLHLSSRTDKRLVFKGALPLVLNYDEEKYIKNLSKYLDRCKKSNVRAGELLVTEYDNISDAQNKSLYESLHQKLKEKKYNTRLSAQVPNVENGKESFGELNLGEQAYLLCELLKLFACNVLTADLRLIGGAGQAGTIRVAKKLNEKARYILIDQSPTGIFEKKIDLMKI